jgi:hypothetical protein
MLRLDRLVRRLGTATELLLRDLLQLEERSETRIDRFLFRPVLLGI